MRTNSLLSRLLPILIVCMALLMPVGSLSADNSPLCFTARNGSVTLTFDIKNVTFAIQYSTDSVNWNTYTPNTNVLLNPDAKVYFRAESDHHVYCSFGAINVNDCSRFYFSSTDGGKIDCSGNIMSLYGPSCPDLPGARYIFSNLFRDCTFLLSAPDLPISVLYEGAFKEMFKGCTSLCVGPALHIECVEGNKCCESMFEGCTSLISVPDFHYVNTIRDSCYMGMFRDCTSLIITPALHINNAKNYACAEMFKGCTSLKAITDLPQGELWHCVCKSMFEDCISLTSIPEFSSDPIGRNSYAAMFKGCTSLKAIPELAPDLIDDSCFYEMFKNCTNLHVNTTTPGKPWQITAEVTTEKDWNVDMFAGTAGSFTGNPESGVTYYIDSTATAVENVCDDNNYTLISNPIKCGDIAYITTSDTDLGGSLVEVFNTNGVCIRQFAPTSSPISIDGLNQSGTYFVRITMSNGDSAIRKIIVR